MIFYFLLSLFCPHHLVKAILIIHRLQQPHLVVLLSCQFLVVVIIFLPPPLLILLLLPLKSYFLLIFKPLVIAELLGSFKSTLLLHLLLLKSHNLKILLSLLNMHTLKLTLQPFPRRPISQGIFPFHWIFFVLFNFLYLYHPHWKIFSHLSFNGNVYVF